MKSRTSCTIAAIAVILEIVGFIFASRGVVRESFVELARERAGLWAPGTWAAGTWSPGVWGERPSAVDRFVVEAGFKLGLLPTERELTTEDRIDNARSAVLGVLMMMGGMLLDAGRKFWLPIVQAGAWLRSTAYSAQRRLRERWKRLAALLRHRS